MKANSPASPSAAVSSAVSAPKPKTKLSYKEKRELEALELELEELNRRKAEVEKILSGEVSASSEELVEASKSYQKLKEELDLKEFRWLELAELA